MDLQHAINEPQVQRDIRIERLGADINRKLIAAYFAQRQPRDLDAFKSLIKLSLAHTHTEKLDILAAVGVSPEALRNFEQEFDAYRSLAIELQAEAYRVERTSYVSIRALLAINLNSKTMVQSPRLSPFLAHFSHLLEALLASDTAQLSSEAAHALYLKHLSEVAFPKNINPNTLCAPLYALCPQAFPLTNSHILQQLKQLLGSFSSDVQGYIQMAQQAAQALKAAGVDPIHFAYLDRALSLSQSMPSETQAVVLDTTEPASPNSESPGKPQAYPLNTIFYGPPGTGKTYRTVDRAVAILDPDYWQQHAADRAALKSRFDAFVDQGHVHFVTFHQSFAYEDFVEGIQASVDEETQTVRYEVQDGVFKQICAAASVRVSGADHQAIDLDGRHIWKMSLGSTLTPEDDYIYEECLNNAYILLGWGEDLDCTGCTSAEEIQARIRAVHGEPVPSNDYTNQALRTFVLRMRPGDLVVISDGNHKFRAIAEITGDYQFLEAERSSYRQMRPVKWLRQYEPSLPKEQLLHKAFSQMTLYQLGQHTLDMRKLEQLLSPSQNPQTPHKPTQDRVLIIDEINRGNISKIFGELITLLEPSKRAGQAEALQVTLPYSKAPFAVPDNVYLIGTMNTADRSLAGLDIALRRRFVFEEMPPDPEQLEGIEVDDLPISDLLIIMNQRIAVLLNADHCIGHSYFMPLQDNPSLRVLAAIFSRQILPLLQEYFFDDGERIRWVLNDHRKPDPRHCFVIDASADPAELFGDIVGLPRQAHSWQINTAAFTSIESYLQILSTEE